ncbi:MAG: beta-N-acetylhexosaminidase [Sphingomonadaceae bacterium]|nr:beta-N-acetylhexosaminidase [Sphingomonadaceae bacterium]
MKPVIFGLSGLTLTDDEKRLFRDVEPAGYIIFGRNIENRQQLRTLTDGLRDVHGRDDVPILIDQEGGRVARMKAPEWPTFPAGGAFDALYDLAPITAIEAARSNAEAIALVLAEVGINVDCLPVLDVRVPDTHSAIGDRALGSDPMRVAALGRAILDGLAAGGVIGVVKHMPGQGRAVVDTHHELPHVHVSETDLEQDLAPFRALNRAAMGMTGHVVYDIWDDQNTATMSRIVIEEVIRGKIGFDGLLMSDDLDMNALSGDVPSRALRCVEAGCDIALNCWGRFDEMVAIAGRLPDISEAARVRLDHAMAGTILKFDADRLSHLLDKRDRLLALANIEAKLTHGATGAA